MLNVGTETRGSFANEVSPRIETLKIAGGIRVNQKLVKRIKERSGGVCENCGGKGDFRGLQIHHIKHKQMGGSKLLDTIENLELLCGKCHSERHGIREC